MRNKFTYLFIVISVLVVAGCATNYGATQIDDFGRYTQLVKSETSKEGVFELFGQPHDVTYFGDSQSVWTYYSVSMTMSGATFVPIVGLVAGGNNADVRIANFYFSPDGRYQKVESLTKGQYVNQWIGMGTVAVKNDEMERVDEEMTRLGLPFDQVLARQMKGTAELFGE
tara:strand:- start:560 stop:1069 length:510 start_codon:yes stop_codon:yes gene_type:complete